jgi:hypothetical protein
MERIRWRFSSVIRSGVDVMTRVRVGESGVRIPKWAIIVSCWKRPNSLWCPPKLQFIDYQSYFFEVKRPRRNVGHFHLAPS